MIIDYLDDKPPACNDCPIIRLMHGSQEDYVKIINALSNLLANDIEFDIFEILGIEEIEKIKSLKFKKSKNLNSIFQIKKGYFECNFSFKLLTNTIERFNNYKENQTGGYYWFDDDGSSWDDDGLEISLLLSQSGTW